MVTKSINPKGNRKRRNSLCCACQLTLYPSQPSVLACLLLGCAATSPLQAQAQQQRHNLALNQQHPIT